MTNPRPQNGHVTLVLVALSFCASCGASPGEGAGANGGGNGGNKMAAFEGPAG